MNATRRTSRRRAQRVDRIVRRAQGRLGALLELVAEIDATRIEERGGLVLGNVDPATWAALLRLAEQLEADLRRLPASPADGGEADGIADGIERRLDDLVRTLRELSGRASFDRGSVAFASDDAAKWRTIVPFLCDTQADAARLRATEGAR